MKAANAKVNFSIYAQILAEQAKKLAKLISLEKKNLSMKCKSATIFTLGSQVHSLDLMNKE